MGSSSPPTSPTTRRGTATNHGASPASSPSPRIPLALQQIFIQSQRGDEVEKIAAPRGGIGFRMFKRAWNGFRHGHNNKDGKEAGAGAAASNSNGGGKGGKNAGPRTPSKPLERKSSIKTSSQGKLLMKAPSTSSLTSLGSRKSLDSDSVISATTTNTNTVNKRPTAADATRAAMKNKPLKPVSSLI